MYHEIIVKTWTMQSGVMGNANNLFWNEILWDCGSSPQWRGVISL